jgi:hypothetical protein
MKILTSPPPKSFNITNEYVWLNDLHTLPIQITCDVTCRNEKDEFLPCFSLTRAEWDSPECDALSWYVSPHRDDFTFRTKLFRDFPSVQRLSPPWRPIVGTKFQMKCVVSSTLATYSINGKDYATATYEEGQIPGQGYFGFANYGVENITVENVIVGGIVVDDNFALTCWFNESGKYSGADNSDTGIHEVGKLIKTGRGGDYTWAYVIAGLNGNDCPRTIDGLPRQGS